MCINNFYNEDGCVSGDDLVTCAVGDIDNDCDAVGNDDFDTDGNDDAQSELVAVCGSEANEGEPNPCTLLWMALYNGPSRSRRSLRRSSCHI